jgi:protein phosphatase
MRAVAAGISDVGLQREHNEDNFAILGEQELYVVADGMGGHRSGDVASRIATDSIIEFFRATSREDVTWPFHFDSKLTDEENRLLTSIRLANRQIVEQGNKSREHQGMGTTVVGALFSRKKRKIFIGHVGDSRAYRVRANQITQMTRDHSLVNDYILAMPELSEEQRNELPKNVITRALGMQDQVTVDLQSDDVESGDLYVLCSDGLSGMIDDQEILELSRTTVDLDQLCKSLVRAANEHGGEDNITAVVIRIEGEPGEKIDLSDTLRQMASPVSQRTGTDATADTPPAAPAEPGAPDSGVVPPSK